MINEIDIEVVRKKCLQIVTQWRRDRFLRYADGDHETVRMILTMCQAFLATGSPSVQEVKDAFNTCKYASFLKQVCESTDCVGELGDDFDDYDHEAWQESVVGESEVSGSIESDIAICDEGVDGESAVLDKYLLESTRRFGTTSQKKLYKDAMAFKERASNRLARKYSRRVQTTSIMFERASAHAIAGLPFVVLNASSANVDLLLSREFSEHVPYCPETLKWFDTHLRQVRNRSRAERLSHRRLDTGFVNLWMSGDRLMREAFNSEKRNERYKFTVGSLAMLLSARWLGNEYISAFTETWDKWQEKKLLKDPHMCRQLAAVGSYFGADRQLDTLRHSRSPRIELAAATVFIHGKKNGQKGTSVLVGSDPERVIHSIASKNGEIAGGILDYVKLYISKAQYPQIGTMMMMMQWTQQAMRLSHQYHHQVSEKTLRSLRLHFGRLIGDTKCESDLKKELDLTLSEIANT